MKDRLASSNRLDAINGVRELLEGENVRDNLASAAEGKTLVRRTHPGKTPEDTIACTASVSNSWGCRPLHWAAESQESPTHDLDQ